ncbi:methionyl-tRNA synthetase, partial [Trifolium medium]|nr:methionyl-tRNA synthetase [Trifolium medium]
DEREVSRRPAHWSCDYCGGMVQIVEVDSQWNFCFLPLCHKTKRRHYCTKCSKKFNNVTYYKPHKESTTSLEERSTTQVRSCTIAG